MSSDHQKHPRGFNLFRRNAEKLVAHPEELAKTLDQAREKLESHSAKLGTMKSDVASLMRMIKAYGRGEYRNVPWKTLVTGLGAVLYFLNPMDVIPDFLLGIGLVDDATVLAFCLASLKGDLEGFNQWEESSKKSD